MASFRPLHDRVLIRQVDADTITKGGIILTGSAVEKPQEGEVVASGAEAHEVAAGDRVLFGKWSGTEITINDEKLLIMKEEDILGILDRED